MLNMTMTLGELVESSLIIVGFVGMFYTMKDTVSLHSKQLEKIEGDLARMSDAFTELARQDERLKSLERASNRREMAH